MTKRRHDKNVTQGSIDLHILSLRTAIYCRDIRESKRFNRTKRVYNSGYDKVNPFTGEPIRYQVNDYHIDDDNINV